MRVFVCVCRVVPVLGQVKGSAYFCILWQYIITFCPGNMGRTYATYVCVLPGQPLCCRMPRVRLFTIEVAYIHYHLTAVLLEPFSVGSPHQPFIHQVWFLVFMATESQALSRVIPQCSSAGLRLVKPKMLLAHFQPALYYSWLRL